MRYFDIKLRAKNDENQLTCCYLTTAENEIELMDKKLTCIEKGKSIDDYYDETEELTGKQAIEKAKGKIMPVVENADTDGYLGARILKDKITWAHSIYFRALTALYDATGDENILDALKNHYLRAPLKDVFEKQKNIFPMLIRFYFLKTTLNTNLLLP